MKNFKFLLPLVSFLAFSPFMAAYAQTPIIANTNANQFAEQSGAIAGTAQACGVNISTLSARTIEVINLLTKIPAEQQQAMMIFQKALTNAQTNQTTRPVLKCSDVIASYNSLPILKDDYKQTVLPAMARLGTGG